MLLALEVIYQIYKTEKAQARKGLGLSLFSFFLSLTLLKVLYILGLSKMEKQPTTVGQKFSPCPKVLGFLVVLVFMFSSNPLNLMANWASKSLGRIPYDMSTMFKVSLQVLVPPEFVKTCSFSFRCLFFFFFF